MTDLHIGPPDDAAGVYRIWPADAPGSEGWTWRESVREIPESSPNRMVRNVVVPTLTRFASPRPNGTAIIVAPGGAFHFLAIDHEGYAVARWLASQNITAFVLKYRVQHTPESEAEFVRFLDGLVQELPGVTQNQIDPPRGHPGADEARSWGEADGRQAIRYLRSHAMELGIDPKRIGILGFSAGGGIAVNAALEGDESSRPDFLASIYGGYRLGPSVPVDAGPLFLAIADNDEAVAAISSARLFEAWHKASRPVELHIFANGAHGFGFNTTGRLSDSWPALFRNWLAANGWLTNDN